MAKLPPDAPKAEVAAMNEHVHEVIARLASTPIPSKPVDDVADPDVGLSREQRMARWQSQRPPIGHLKEGVVTGPAGERLPLFDIGDRIVVECKTRLLKGTPWLETIVGRVRSINDDTGIVSVTDEESDPRLPMIRYASTSDDLYDFRIPPAKGNPFLVPSNVPKPALPKEPGKRSRGRPRGSKNRPKEKA